MSYSSADKHYLQEVMSPTVTSDSGLKLPTLIAMNYELLWMILALKMVLKQMSLWRVVGSSWIDGLELQSLEQDPELENVNRQAVILLMTTVQVNKNYHYLKCCNHQEGQGILQSAYMSDAVAVKAASYLQSFCLSSQRRAFNTSNLYCLWVQIYNLDDAAGSAGCQKHMTSIPLSFLKHCHMSLLKEPETAEDWTHCEMLSVVWQHT